MNGDYDPFESIDNNDRWWWVVPALTIAGVIGMIFAAVLND